MKTLRELADQRTKLTWQDNPRGYLESLIQEKWVRGANSMLLSKVSYRDFVPDLARQLVGEVSEQIRKSLPPDAPRIKGKNTKKRVLEFQQGPLEIPAPGLILPEQLTSEKLIVLISTSLREGLQAACELEIDSYDHELANSRLSGFPPIRVHEKTSLKGKIILK